MFLLYIVQSERADLVGFQDAELLNSFDSDKLQCRPEFSGEFGQISEAFAPYFTTQVGGILLPSHPLSGEPTFVDLIQFITQKARVLSSRYGTLGDCCTKVPRYSQLVLQYINNQSTRFCTFLANRLVVIQEYSMQSEWKHVKSSQNPADRASGGINGVNDLSRWMCGPEFIKKSNIPLSSVTPNRIPNDEELKTFGTTVNAIST
ncbi:WDFY family member 4 [Clonorchis sinensis]|uniref:WDFY family member 4 n=1 Tax=Clonorchis sinensis TaxID=79923 RepID=G7YCH2_CLOSI|nr:WDFY family member 4 [Clonorchis sinensis]